MTVVKIKWSWYMWLCFVAAVLSATVGVVAFIVGQGALVFFLAAAYFEALHRREWWMSCSEHWSKKALHWINECEREMLARQALEVKLVRVLHEKGGGRRENAN